MKRITPFSPIFDHAPNEGYQSTDSQPHMPSLADKGMNDNFCAPSPMGCLRCQSVSYGQRRQIYTARTALLLGPQDADMYSSLYKILINAHIPFTEIGPVFVLSNVRARRGEISMLLKEQLSSYAHSCIRATYAPSGAETAEQALAAFLFAEPLTKMLAHMEHEWVRDALAEDWLFSVFHPIIDVHSGEVFAQEALLRARNGDDGSIIGAGPIIEACEVLHIQHLLDQRARQAAIRGGAAHVPASQQLFINFLPNTIYDPEICLRTTVQAADEWGVPLSRLVFEVVETERIPDIHHLCRILDYYRARGVGTAVDDMGAGFTSVEYLSALRPDYVKLDRNLVVGAEGSIVERQKLDVIVNAARSLDIKIIAEGIETRAQLDMCIEAGVDYVQGYLFAQPACPPQPVRFAEIGRPSANYSSGRNH